ncbi:MAG: HigA family addiction module antidote protein [Nitrospinae bacterium]|nr:HigA family addiction module antidote protein [Nitrospinota bacterium]
MEKKRAPVPPGEVLMNLYMEPLGISQNSLARAMKVPPRRINEIVLGKRAITADTAIRLGKVFETSAEMWMNLQNHYEMELARDKAGTIIRTLKPIVVPA